MITAEKKARFTEIIGNIYKTNITKGIGTYQEKTLHKVIKNYYEAKEEYQEVKINGYVADIFKDNKIIEIQTRSFNKLRDKLEVFLKDYKVNIIYPIAYKKYISWLDLETGEEKDFRKSPKTGSIYDCIFELYKIKKYLNHPNLKITLLFIDLKEQRLLNGWNQTKKKGAERFNQIPLELIDEIEINNYNIFIPFKNQEFTSIDYQKAIKRNLHCAQVSLTILNYLDVIEVVRKEKRRNVYRLKKLNS